MEDDQPGGPGLKRVKKKDIQKSGAEPLVSIDLRLLLGHRHELAALCAHSSFDLVADYSIWVLGQDRTHYVPSCLLCPAGQILRNSAGFLREVSVDGLVIPAVSCRCNHPNPS